jgi:hypothetical protein
LERKWFIRTDKRTDGHHLDLNILSFLKTLIFDTLQASCNKESQNKLLEHDLSTVQDVISLSMVLSLRQVNIQKISKYYEKKQLNEFYICNNI